MSTTKMRRGAAPIAILTLAAFLAAMLPPRVAQADALATIPDGTGGPGAPDNRFNQPRISRGATRRSTSPRGPRGAAYPFQLQTARGDAQPGLGLAYDSSAGMGLAGGRLDFGRPRHHAPGRSGLPHLRRLDERRPGSPRAPPSTPMSSTGCTSCRFARSAAMPATRRARPPGRSFRTASTATTISGKRSTTTPRILLQFGRANVDRPDEDRPHPRFRKPARLRHSVFGRLGETLPTNSVFPAGPQLNQATQCTSGI